MTRAKVISLDQCKWYLSLNEDTLPVYYSNSLDPEEGDSIDIQKYRDLRCSRLQSSVHMILYEHGLIEHPYKDFNELKYQWIPQCDWTFYTMIDTASLLSIMLTGDEKQEVFIICDGIDTISDVYIEEEKMFSTDNMFKSYRFNIMPFLTKYADTRAIKISIRIKSALRCARELSENAPYAIPCPEYTQAFETPGRNYVRKCGSDFGWDWGPCFAPMGISGPIKLVTYSNFLLLDFLVQQNLSSLLVNEKEATPNNVQCSLVNITVKCLVLVHEGHVLRIGQLKWSLFGPGGSLDHPIQTGSQAITFASGGEHFVEFHITLSDPELWWPNGYGKQPLYKIEVSLDDLDAGSVGEMSEFETRTKTIGIRTVEIDTSKDDIGNKFMFKVNSVPIYAKGSNWIPSDCFHQRVGKEHLKVILESAMECHMNFLRVWGGGIYETDEFYNLCDEMGILIWQDMMFACALYPSANSFLSSVGDEVRKQLFRLQSHPCIALYAGNNENEEALYSWDECQTSPYSKQFVVDYSKLYTDTIFSLIKELDPDRGKCFWPSSPSNGPNQWGNPQDLTRGDAHYWGVWHGQKPFTEYLTIIPRFSSEFGFQSLPSMQTLKPFLSNTNDDYNLSSLAMEFRQRSFKVGNKAILEHIYRHFKIPKSLPDMIYVSQVLQALSIKTACEHWRRQKAICSGAMYWQLNDIWPGASWSSIEWNSRWKLLQYFSKKFFAPILVSVVEKDMKADVWLTSDVYADIMGQLKARLISYETGKVLKQWTVDNVSVAGAGSNVVLSIDLLELFGKDSPTYYPYTPGICAPFKRTDCFLVYHFVSKDGKYNSENWHFFCPLKYVNLPKPVFQITKKDDTSFNIVSNHVALFVSLHASSEEEDTVDVATVARFSDSGFIMLPGESRTISLSLNSFGYQSISSVNIVESPDQIIQAISLRDSY